MSELDCQEDWYTLSSAIAPNHFAYTLSMFKDMSDMYGYIIHYQQQ